MKAVLMSIKPKWCEKIFNGEKTVEVRKTAPKEVPFKAYIYCTAIKDKKYYTDEFDIPIETGMWKGNSHIVGEFICDNVEKFNVGSLRSDDIEELACLSYTELISYFYKPCELDGKTAKQGCAWHISKLKIYDEPRELSEFRTIKCTNKKGSCSDCKIKPDCIKYLTRPPQSWCYVEELC